MVVSYDLISHTYDPCLSLMQIFVFLSQHDIVIFSSMSFHLCLCHFKHLVSAHVCAWFTITGSTHELSLKTGTKVIIDYIAVLDQ